ncbi:MAG: AarF/ABC1/UbiB kinase family protein [Limnochordaceae bacterium]|nr:AarF/ABC1/UbiB kinase family protein [Limnochordaceae bacterium]
MSRSRPAGEPRHPDREVPGLSRPLRHLRRYRQVAEVLARHGFAVVLESLGLRRLLPAWHRAAPAAGGPVHLRQALEELGPTFIKLGQVLSLRADLLPREYVEELARLQDRVAPEPFELSRKTIEEELGAPVERLFARLDPHPMASASLGQVYEGTLPTGEAIVVKVLRAGVEEQVQTDLEIIDDLAKLARERLAERLIDPVRLAEEFARIMRRELDYRFEARHIQRFRHNFRHDRRIRIPRVYDALSGRRVLTLERLWGVKISEWDRLQEMGVDRRALARTGAQIFLKMVLVDHFFHGDPHPGNLLVEPDGRLGVLDYGMVAALRPQTTEQLVRVFLAVVRQDAEGAVRGMRRMGIVPPGADTQRLVGDLEDLIARNYGRPISELVLADVVRDSLDVAYQHRLVLPSELLLLARALLLLDGLGRQLDPSFNPLEVAVPFARRLVLRRLTLRRQAQMLLGPLQEVVEVVRTLPQRVDRLLEQAETGRLAVRWRPDGYEVPLRRLERAVNRLAMALLAGGLAIAGALLWDETGPRLAGIHVAAGLALMASIGLSAGLFWGIWRSGRL